LDIVEVSKGCTADGGRAISVMADVAVSRRGNGCPY
jgi:hypothetical protein